MFVTLNSGCLSLWDSVAEGLPRARERGVIFGLARLVDVNLDVCLTHEARVVLRLRSDCPLHFGMCGLPVGILRKDAPSWRLSISFILALRTYVGVCIRRDP